MPTASCWVTSARMRRVAARGRAALPRRTSYAVCIPLVIGHLRLLEQHVALHRGIVRRLRPTPSLGRTSRRRWSGPRSRYSQPANSAPSAPSVSSLLSFVGRASLTCCATASTIASTSGNARAGPKRHRRPCYGGVARSGSQRLEPSKLRVPLRSTCSTVRLGQPYWPPISGSGAKLAAAHSSSACSGGLNHRRSAGMCSARDQAMSLPRLVDR